LADFYDSVVGTEGVKHQTAGLHVELKRGLEDLEKRNITSLLHSHGAGERNTPAYSIDMEQVRGTTLVYSSWSR
jgi:hypothetical protein